MSIKHEQLLAAIQPLLDSECASKAAELLSDAEARMIDGAPTREEVRCLLPTLRARRENAVRTGKRIFGLPQMIARLEGMNSAAVVVGYGFISPKSAGNVYFTEDDRGLGATLVDR